MNKLSIPFIIGLVSAIVVGGLTGYTYFAKSSLEGDVKNAQANATKLEHEVLNYESKKIEEAVSAKQTVDALADSFVKWSQIVEKVLVTIPKESGSRDDLIEFTSYSGAQNNTLSLSARTVDGSKDPYGAVAELIRSFENSEYFETPFIPSISTSTGGDGDVVLVFNFQVDYVTAGFKDTGRRSPTPAN